MPKEKFAETVMKLQSTLKEFSDFEGSTFIDGIIHIMAEMQIRIECLEKKANEKRINIDRLRKV